MARFPAAAGPSSEGDCEGGYSFDRDAAIFCAHRGKRLAGPGIPGAVYLLDLRDTSICQMYDQGPSVFGRRCTLDQAEPLETVEGPREGASLDIELFGELRETRALVCNTQERVALGEADSAAALIRA